MNNLQDAATGKSNDLMSNKSEPNIKVMSNRTSELKDTKMLCVPEGDGVMAMFVTPFMVLSCIT